MAVTPTHADGGFMLDGIRFRALSQPPWHLDHTDDEKVVLLKEWFHVRTELAVFEPIAPERMLELGIWEGGSAVIWPLVLPTLTRYSAIDLSDRVPAYGPAVREHPRFQTVRLHPSTSQDDRAALRSIVAEDFDGPLDVVLDDASHRYAPTLASFETLFPLMRPGGVYVIEDWSWAHRPAYIGTEYDTFPAMSDLILRLALLAGSPGDVVRRLTVGPWIVVIERGAATLDETFTIEGSTVLGNRVFTPLQVP